jgi:hypothetical protein
VCGDIKWINVSSDKFNGGLLWYGNENSVSLEGRKFVY